jgi:hypothetical protein
MKKEEVLKIIDEVMNNREIDSIRNAVLAIRDKIIEYPDIEEEYTARLKLRGSEISQTGEYFEGAKYLCVDTAMKIDSGIYGGYWYE